MEHCRSDCVWLRPDVHAGVIIVVSTAYRAWAVWWYDIPLPIVVLASSHLHQENVDFRHYQVRRLSTLYATAGLHLDTRLSSRPLL